MYLYVCVHVSMYVYIHAHIYICDICQYMYKNNVHPQTQKCLAMSDQFANKTTYLGNLVLTLRVLTKHLTKLLGVCKRTAQMWQLRLSLQGMTGSPKIKLI